MWFASRISYFTFRLNRNLFIKFVLSGMMIRNKSYKSAFGSRMHVSCSRSLYVYIFSYRNAILALSVCLSVFFLQSPFRFYACLLIAAFCLQDQIIVTAVECSLHGAFVFASASPECNSWTELFAAISRVRIRNRTRLVRLFIGIDWPISTLTIFAND